MQQLYDVVIVGGGPAGLTAALYLARAKYRVLVLEKEQIGGQIAITENVVNYPGIASVSGRELTDTMRKQAESFGAEFRMEEARSLDLDQDVKIVGTDRGEYRCFGLLLATGAHPRPVGFRGEEEYRGRGVAYCATCDGEFFTGKDVFVVGGGYAAAEESVFLTKFARHVTILIRGKDFSCAASVAEKARNHEKITVLTNTVLEEVSGENGLDYARYTNRKIGETTQFRAAPGETFGVFVLAGYAPETTLCQGLLERNEQGYLITDDSRKTSVDGVYAAGDVCIKPLRQVVTATGDGALAATELEKYVALMQEKTGLRPEKSKESHENGLPSETREQLAELFAKMEHPLRLVLSLDEKPISRELESLMEELAAMTEKLTLSKDGQEDAPCVCVWREDGTPTGMAFHGVPGGHEFSSFVLGLYNAAGPGQPLDEETVSRMRGLPPADLKILVTLSCSMCPETVVSAQRLAVVNPGITAHVYDAAHFEELRNRYHVMSVPCLVIDNERVSFGKKNLPQLLSLLENR